VDFVGASFTAHTCLLVRPLVHSD